MAAAAAADIRQQRFVLAVPVDVGPPGHAVSVSGPAVVGRAPLPVGSP